MFHCPFSRPSITSHCFTLVAAGMLVLSGAPNCPATEQPVAAPEAGPVSPLQVKKLQVNNWIHQLDANQYESRQLAQRKLASLGLASLADVTQVAQSGSLESSTRALNILLSWSDSPEAKLRISALEKIATLANRPKEARIATGLLDDAREQVALQAIALLGADYGKDRQVHGIDNLQIVIDKNWKGGTEGLHHLALIPRATTISFHSATLDATTLEQLQSLSHVHRFEFYGTNLSKKVIEKFDAQLPPSVITAHRGGALLGIRGNVIEVEPGSAAFQAGIRPGDLITQINGEEVADFESLTDRIGTHKPGDTVKLTVQRNKEISTIPVTFGQWGDGQLADRSKRLHQLKNRNKTKRGLMPKNIHIERR